MNQPAEQAQQTEWMCVRCGLPLESAPITAAYMGNVYAAALLKCPKCGLVLVPEELALGKMAEVEKTLEDK